MKERIENSLTLEDVLSNKKYSVNYYQREYRWGRKQVEQLIEDLTNSFDDSFDREKAVELHGSGKDLGQFIKALLDEFGVTDLSIYIK